MVVPRFVEQALHGLPLTVYGDGTQKRCFCHVSDAVEAIIKLAACRKAEGQIINVGSDEEVSINELAERTIAATGSKSKIHHIPYANAYAEGFEDMQRRVPSLVKLKSFIDWEPKTNLDQILAKLNCSTQPFT
jgi:UDP-glucose 4-epimerase